MKSTSEPEPKRARVEQPTPNTKTNLQQQIQAQLQRQLQDQLQAAAKKGTQANITPEQIQAQAQAMVQAAAQAQAVVSAAKSRGDGLVPMTAQQIAALSRIQAQAIVSARPQTALLASGTPTVGKDGNPIQPTDAQIQHQIQLQAQALVHAHTQAQIAAGIYKGDAGGTTTTTTTTTKTTQASAATTNLKTTVTSKQPLTVPSNATKMKATPVSSQTPAVSRTQQTTTTNPIISSPLASLTPTQIAQQNKLATRQNTTKDIMLKRHVEELNNVRQQFTEQNLAMTPSSETQANQQAQIKAITDRHASEIAQLNKSFQKDLNELHAEFRKQNAAAEYAGVKVAASGGNNSAHDSGSSTTNGLVHHPTSVARGPGGTATSMQMTSSTSTGLVSTGNGLEDNTVTSSTSSAFLEKLSGTLNHFWTDQLRQMRDLGTTVPQTEHDFKNHNDLPLARIKRIMKSDEDVRMISAEAPVLFAKACEMFILELTLRSWSYSENNKRRTLQKEDIREAIQRTDIFDFLVDVIH